MKSKISQATKKSVSLLLAILMMFSMLTVGLTVTVNAAGLTLYVAGNFGDGKTPSVLRVWVESDNDNQLVATDKTYNGFTVYKAENCGTGNYTHLRFTDNTSWQNVIDNKSSAGYNNQLYYSPDGNQSNATWVSNWDSTTTEYTVTVGSTTGGSISGVTTGDKFAKDANVSFTVTASEGYQIDTVSYTPENGTPTTLTGSNGNYSFQMPASNVTINATFTATATPKKDFYFFYWDGKSNVKNDMKYNNGSYYIYTDNTLLSNNRKFKISSATTCSTTDGTDNATWTVNHNIPTLEVSTNASNAGVTITQESGENKDLILGGSGSDYAITYTPDYQANSNGLKGTVKVWTKAEYEALLGTTGSLTLSKTTASLVAGETLTLTATHKADCTTKTVTFTSDKTDVATVTLAEDGTGLVTAVKNGTATITATCENCGSATCTVTVSTVSFAVSNRIYAYANGSTTNIQSNAWVCSEDADASKLDTHNDTSTAQPKLGSTSASNLRIFLPTTVGDSVLLYNSFSEDVTINGVTIPSNDCAVVTFESGTAYSFTVGGSNKKLTLYKSAADGALYLNNTGIYAGVSDDGTVKMVNDLFTAADKDASELKIDNCGAIADSNGVTNVAVKKVKGRGNSTWVSANKKSFNVTFGDNLGGLINKDFKGKKYSLLANFKDPSLSRNKILYQLAKDMKIPYVPATATVDVYMNGLYLGSYLMCQKVEVGKSELIKDLGKTLLEDLYTDKASGKVLETSANDIKTKGFSFLMELDSNAAQGDFFIEVTEAGFNQKITIKEPEYLDDNGNIPTDVVTQAAQNFVKNKYTELIKALNDTNITFEQLNAIVDVESLVKYFIVNEIAKNYDIGVSSTYFVYKRDVDANGTVLNTGKFYASPVWDMDVTTGNCKSSDSNFQSYEGNWTDNLNEGTGNKFMAKVFANPVIQAAARKLWTDSYYTTLTNAINAVYDRSVAVEGSLNNNYAKWNYPYGFQGKYKDDVQARKTLKKASYSNGTYTVKTEATGYSNGKDGSGNDVYLAKGQIEFIKDWLTSRVAWLTNKYNTYYITGNVLTTGGWDDAKAMDNVGNGVNKYTISNLPVGTYEFKICTDGGLENNKEGESQIYRDWTATSISYNKDLNLESTSSNITTPVISTDGRTNITFTTSKQMTVYVTYNQLTNTVTLSDTVTTSTAPKVTLSGSDVANEDIKDGTPVTLTATVTPAINNNAVVYGDYTVTLYRGTVKVGEPQTVNFTESSAATQNVVFKTTLASTNDSFHVVVSKAGYDDVTSSPVEYKQTGVKDKKIYFDPSGNNDWKGKITADTIVKVTVNNSSGNPLDSFDMAIDTDDIHGLDKGVFRALVNEETLAKLQVPSNKITFALSGGTVTVTADGNSSVTDGWIYTSTSESGKTSMWAQYNTTYTEEYPHENITNYQQFEDYLKAQATPGGNTDNIVYFDNSVSQWYNVYIYGWVSGLSENAVQMKKLPYADIWYYDFGSTPINTGFLFKDRSGATFGTDYQETVDLVDGSVYNGDGDTVSISFANTIGKANPIFITSNFYNCTTSGATGIDGSTNTNNILKFRAFNTEWKEFYTVATSAVKTKAVDVYFDMHRNDAQNIKLYHNSTADGYTMTTEFTRLTQLGTSNIYYARIDLPYTTDESGNISIAFKFSKFGIINADGTETPIYNMSDNVQPKSTCITTGEVWYEFGEHTTTNKAKTSTGASSKTPLVTTGANVSLAETGYSIENGTFYFKKPDSWTNVRLAIGGASTNLWRTMYAPTEIIGNVYKFSGISWRNYDGFYFIDSSLTQSSQQGNYLDWTSGSSNYTDKIEGDTTNYYYELASGSSGAVNAQPFSEELIEYTCPTNVLKGTNVMFYYGHSWDDSYVYLNTSGNQGGNIDGGSATSGKINNTDWKYRFACAQVGTTYYVANTSAWKPGHSIGTVAAGAAYRVYNPGSGNTCQSYPSTSTLNDYDKTATMTVGDSSVNINVTPANSTSVVGKNNSVKYYITTDNATFSEFDPKNTSELAQGTYTVYPVVTDGNIYVRGDAITLTVNAPVITYSVTLDKTTLSLDINGTKTATLKATPAGFTNPTITWTSSNPTVVSVDQNGNVTANQVTSEPVTITVKYTEGNIERTASCDVTVSDTSSITSFMVNGKESDTIELNATATLSIVTVPDTANVTYTVTKAGTSTTDATVSEDGTTFSATVVGTYLVKATLDNGAYKEVTITVTDSSSQTTTDYCGILGYTHSTATFESTTGGKIDIDSVKVILNGGYYTDGAYETGYATTTGGVTTIIYAIPTAKTGATTVYTSTTSGENGYNFNGWNRDGIVISENTDFTITDAVTGTATVSYVANWSQVKEVTYTFVYTYDKFNTDVNGQYSPEYDPGRALIKGIYEVQVNVQEGATDEEILALFKSHAPILSSDYFNYSFDGVTPVTNVGDKTVTGKANIIGEAKKYSVTLKDAVGGTNEVIDSYFYQNIVTLTKEPATGKTIVWKNEATGAVLGYGNTYKFRISKNITISYEEIEPVTSTGRTVVNAPTYEFYTLGSTQKVRFNFLVENFVAPDTKVNEYGVLYFFTDADGAPVDKTIAQDKNISKETLISAAKGGVDGIMSYNATNIVNNRNRYIFAPSLSYTPANTDRYLRVFSYYIQDDGTVVVSDYNSVVLGSIRDAIS